MGKITYNDKVALITNPDIADENKVTDNDMNEIKQVVNENDDKFLTNGLNVSNEVDEDYRVNFIKEKNKVQPNNIYMQYGINDVNGTLASNQPARVCVFQVKVKPNTQYTISCASGYLIGNVFQYNESKTYTTKVGSEYIRSKQYTSNSTTHYISFVLRNTDNTTIPTSEISNIKVQVEEGNTETSYEPYIVPSIYVDNEEIYSKDNLEQYSTSEIRIGTWIDGKPLYRRTFQTTNFSSSNNTIIDLTGMNINIPVRIYGMYRSTIGNSYPMPLTDSSQNYSVLFFTATTVRGRVVQGDGGTCSTAYITIEYTKTSD